MDIKKNSDYIDFFNELKDKIISSRISASKFVNKELILLYWNIGKEINQRQEKLGWGKSIVELLSKDLKKVFPNLSGFSTRNLWDMKRFYSEYKENKILRQLVAEIPWGHNLLILNKIKDEIEREFYIKSTIEMGFTRDILGIQIKNKLYQRSMLDKKQNNFEKALPKHLSEQAEKSMKDVYILDFLGISKPILEKELEDKIIDKLKDFILELGYGFAFIGNQYKISTPNKDYFLDLLFYHRKLKCLVVFELKIGEFKAEYAGKMNLYLNILDEFVKEKDENPSIGIILCAEKDNFDVEYALRGISKPMGVSEYKLTKDLPEDLKGSLPSIEEIKRIN
jgi:predicted nuclease of restriction endonuclease-like (RecB) superfamily